MRLTVSLYLARLTDCATQYVLGGRSTERSLLESWHVVSCLAMVPAQCMHRSREMARPSGMRKDFRWSQVSGLCQRRETVGIRWVGGEGGVST